MKRIAAALMIAGVGLMAGSAVVDAYPPGSATATVDDSTPAPGAAFKVTVNSCRAGETVNFAFQGQTDTDTCAASGTAGFLLGFVAAPASGTASGDFVAPTAPGTYGGTAALVTSAVTLSFSVTVEAAPTSTLPATGSSGSNTTMIMATILLLAGAGMFGVAQVRRRQTLAG